MSPVRNRNYISQDFSDKNVKKHRSIDYNESDYDIYKTDLKKSKMQ
jgi:hypothetical protein